MAEVRGSTPLGSTSRNYYLQAIRKRNKDRGTRITRYRSMMVSLAAVAKLLFGSATDSYDSQGEAVTP
jgi:hypothetical protein